MNTDSLPYAEIMVEPGLVLTQLTENQADDIYRMIDQSREHLAEWLPWVNNTRSPEDSRTFIRSMVAKRKRGEEYGYGIVLNGVPVGHMSLMHLRDDKQPEIGYWISASAAGGGITTKSVMALTRFGLGELKLDAIIIRANPKNIASNRVAEKAGYTHKTTRKDEDGVHNIWEIVR